MKKNNYEMITVKEYVQMLDNEVTYLNADAKEIKANVEKYLKKVQKDNLNANLLELLLA